MKARWFVLSIVLAFTACGGGDNAAPPVKNMQAHPPVYEYQVGTFGMTAEQMLQLLNTQGARGYRHLWTLNFPDEAEVFKSLQVSDAETTYTYELVDAPMTSGKFVEVANAEGAKGFQFVGVYEQGHLYRRDDRAGVLYRYLALPRQKPFDESGAALFAQANAQGAQGYRFLTEWGGSIYERKSTGGSYVFERLDAPATEEAFVAQWNAQGARGFHPQVLTAFDEDLGYLFDAYVRDEAQPDPFNVELRDVPKTSAALLTQINGEGAKGNIFFGAHPLPGGAIKNIFLRAAK